MVDRAALAVYQVSNALVADAQPTNIAAELLVLELKNANQRADGIAGRPGDRRQHSHDAVRLSWLIEDVRKRRHL